MGVGGSSQFDAGEFWGDGMADRPPDDGHALRHRVATGPCTWQVDLGERARAREAGAARRPSGNRVRTGDFQLPFTATVTVTGVKPGCHQRRDVTHRLPWRVVAPSARLGTRRALVIYLAAVVGPTLVVLVAGALAVRRQAEALDTLQVTTRALQEARIAEDVERQAIERAGAALRDARLAVVAALPADAPPEDIDRARESLRSYHRAHPIVQDVVVMEEHLVVYPRVESPLPERVDTWLLSEPAPARAALVRHVARAAAQERRRCTRRGCRDLCQRRSNRDDSATDGMAAVVGGAVRSDRR